MTNIMETDYLYHYTSLEKLALILKNRTIRLSPLDKMDDRQEQKTSDVENIGRFVFVSSWADDSAESIPMWKMYTDPLAGVRIRMRKNPFKWHTTKGTDLEKILHIECTGANRLAARKQAMPFCVSCTGIQRPLAFSDLCSHPGHERLTGKQLMGLPGA